MMKEISNCTTTHMGVNERERERGCFEGVVGHRGRERVSSSIPIPCWERGSIKNLQQDVVMASPYIFGVTVT